MRKFFRKNEKCLEKMRKCFRKNEKIFKKK